MKKGSSGNRNRPPQQSRNRYPTRDNVYSLQQERQRRQQAEQPPRQTPKKKKRKRKNGHLIMPFIIFAIVALYLIGQLGTLLSKRSDINVETVAYGTIDTPEVYTGLILRDEYVVESSRAGQPYYQYSQGDYVPKGAVVCIVKDTDSTDKLEAKLNKIDKDILESQKARTDLSAFSEDISRLEDNVTRTVDSYAGRTMKSDFSYIYTMKSQVESFMEQRNEIWMTENVDSLSQLTEEKNVYEQQLAKSQSSLTAEAAGVLCLSYDGLEDTLSPEMAAEVTEKQIGSSKTQYISKAKDVQKGDPLFKIVESNQWYIVAYLPNAEAAAWKEKDSYTLQVMTEEETYSIAAQVESLEVGEKKTKVVFSSYEYMEEFMEDRTVSFSLENAVVEGLKIPNSAIVEKSLLQIPRTCVTESLGSSGVLLVSGEESKFVELTILTSDEDYIYIEQEKNSLKMGDVVLQGTGENAAQYTLTDLSPHAGVYVANSSMANFVVVEILEQNQEYAIVKAGDIVGLQPYDTIVSDAKNITEGQNIY